MKSTYYLLSCLFTATVGFGQTSDGKVELQIAADPVTTVADSPLYINITAFNNSKDDVDASTIVYKMNNEYSMYSFDVRDAANNLIPKREYPHFELSSSSAYNRTIKAGERLKDTIAVNRIYEMSKPGIYTIRVYCKLPEELGGKVVLSNPVKVTITAPAATVDQ